MTQANVLAASGSAGVSQGFKNRIINGAMMIDQRYAGASVTPANSGYTLDRWFFTLSQSSKLTCQQNAGSVTPPAGFTKYLGVTSSSAYTVGSSEIFLLRQSIEGFNVADLAWGTASAKTVTLSAWVYSSLTGTFGGTIRNGAGNRFYPFSYTISSANTWTQISVTIAGDTTGTWATDNTVGIDVMFSLGAGATVSGTAGSWGSTAYYSVTGATSVVGTNGATFYITGVQLEVGSSATNFEFRDFMAEFAKCQRYFQKSFNLTTALGTATTTGSIAWVPSSSSYGEAMPTVQLRVSMRTTPSWQCYSTITGSAGYIRNLSTSSDVAVGGTNTNGENGFSGMGGSYTANQLYAFQYSVSAEL